MPAPSTGTTSGPTSRWGTRSPDSSARSSRGRSPRWTAARPTTESPASTSTAWSRCGPRSPPPKARRSRRTRPTSSLGGDRPGLRDRRVAERRAGGGRSRGCRPAGVTPGAGGTIVGARRTKVRLDERPESIRSAPPPGPRPAVAPVPDRPPRRRLLAAGAGAAALVACGAPGGAGETPGGGTAAQQPAKLLWEIRGGPTYQELVEEGLKLFNQRFPKVTVETFPKEGAWQEKLLAGWAAGAGADVFQAWDDNFWRFAAN